MSFSVVSDPCLVALSNISTISTGSRRHPGDGTIDRITIVKWEVVKTRFFVDPSTEQPHIYEHDVDEEEVEDVLREPGDDFPGRRESRIALGQTEAGRYLQVVYVPDPEPDSVFVITAYELKGKALAAYRCRRKRK